MSDRSDSIGGFLAMDDAGRQRLRDVVGRTAWLMEIGSRLGKALPEGTPGAAAAQVAERVTELLETPISRILAEAWSSDADVAAAGVGQGIALVPLGEHTIASTHRPAVEVTLEGVPLGTVEFEVKLEVKLDGALVGIREGRIVELRAGKATAKASLACAGAPVADRRGELKLPGIVRFAEGIPLAPPRVQPPPRLEVLPEP